MGTRPVRYALMRDGTAWEGRISGLEAGDTGVLTLLRVPAPHTDIDLPGSYDVPASGLAVAAGCADLFLADSPGHRLVMRLAGSGHNDPKETVFGLPGPPADVLIHRQTGWLYVAVAAGPDAGIYVFHVAADLSALTLRTIWRGPPLREPAGLAADAAGRLYVLDRAAQQVMRIFSDGTLDPSFSIATTQPCFQAVGTDQHGETLYISDSATNSVSRFRIDRDEALPPIVVPNLIPRALSCHERRLYLADATDGRIAVVDPTDGALVGHIPRYRGPVAGLTTDAQGNLYVKPAPAAEVQVLNANSGYIAEGRLTSGPLDAGARTSWYRLAVHACGDARISYAVARTSDATPIPGDFVDAAGPDVLLPVTGGPEEAGESGRFLWLRATLRGGGRDSPTLSQVVAQTAGENYLDHLPAVYRRADARNGSGFLGRFLALFQAVLGDAELALADMPLRFSPEEASYLSVEALEWLASWMAMDLPRRMTRAERVETLHRVPDLYRRRGTPSGLQDFIELYTGVRTRITEAFRERNIWLLPADSSDEIDNPPSAALLGFDTALAPASAAGLVVPDEPVGCSRCAPTRTGSSNRRDPGIAIGEAVVGETGPLKQDDLGEPLFYPTAHLFTVMVRGSDAPTPALRAAIRQVIEAEKPAHTDYHLCFVEPRMRVGRQARIGVDTIVARPPEPGSLGAARLSEDAYLDFDAIGTGSQRLGPGFHLSSQRSH